MDPCGGPAQASISPTRSIPKPDNQSVSIQAVRHLLPWPQVGYSSRAAQQRALLIESAIFEFLGELSELQTAFWSALVAWAPEAPTVQTVSRRFGIRPTTFNSRFLRNGLPTPKEYLVGIRLCYAARLFDEEEQTITQVAFRLRYASPQSFARHLSLYWGMTPSEFKAKHTLPIALDRLADELFLRHTAALEWFSPLEHRGRTSVRLGGA